MTDSTSNRTDATIDDAGNERTDPADRSPISRRSTLKLLGVAAVPLASTPTAAETSTGFGEGGYGSGTYGGKSEEEDKPEEPPNIVEYDVEENSPPNPHAEIHVESTTTDPNGNLDRLTIELFDVEGTAELVDYETVSISGSSASIERSFEISHGGGSSYRVVLSVRNTTGLESTEERRTEA